MVKPSINPEGGLKKEKGKESGLAAFAVIPLACEEPLQQQKEYPATVVTVPVRRRGKFGLCLCISTVIVVMLVLGVGMALFLGHHRGKYTFVCGVGYDDYEDYNMDEGSMGKQQGSLDEEIEVDPSKLYERIEIPEQDEYERLTILHDFTVNMTAYRLWQSDVCYITWLDVAIVMGPSEFIKRAEENPDFLSEHYESVYETYRAVLPQLESLDYGFGHYIPILCSSVDTFWIEKIPESEMEEWEEFWEHYDEEEEEKEDDDDDVPHEPPHPEHRRRRAAKEQKSYGTEIKLFSGYNVQNIQIFKAEATQLKKEADKLAA